MKALAGLVAVVTGGANGIGRAIALELAGAGMHLAVADVDAQRVEATASELRASGVPALGVVADVRSLEAVQHLAERVATELGPVRVLVNNAGVGLIEPLATITDEDWHWVMDVNFFGVVNSVQAFLPTMLATEGEKHIVNTASMSGLFTSRDLAGYNASKYAVVGLTEAMHDELAERDIGVSLLCPGVVATGIMGRSRKLRSIQSRPATQLGRTPERGAWSAERIVEPEAVGRLVLQGILENELYLFTHPEARAEVAERFDRILAAFDRI